MGTQMEKGKNHFREQAKSALSQMSLKRGAKGGHLIVHHFEMDHENPMRSREEETHVFGKGDGHKMMKHIEKHMGVTGVKMEPEGANVGNAGEEEGGGGKESDGAESEDEDHQRKEMNYAQSAGRQH